MDLPGAVPETPKLPMIAVPVPGPGQLSVTSALVRSSSGSIISTSTVFPADDPTNNANNAESTKPAISLPPRNAFSTALTVGAINRIIRWYKNRQNPRKKLENRFYLACQLGLPIGVTNCIVLGEVNGTPLDLDKPNPNDIWKRNALQIVAGEGHFQVLRILLDFGASGLVQDEVKGNTALAYACQNTPAAIAKEEEARQSAQAHAWKAAYVTGEAPEGCYDCAKVLCRKFPKALAFVNNDAQNALHVAAGAGFAEIAELLCEEGMDPNVVDKLNRAPIHLATWRGDFDVTKVLLARGADVRLRNKIGRTPLHVAAVYGHTKVCEALIKAGAPLDVINHNGNTPLHLACLDGFDETASLLVSHGAGIHLCNVSGLSPLRIALEDDRTSNLALQMLDTCRTDAFDTNLFGDVLEINYDMRAIDTLPQRHCFGVEVPGVGEVHPMAKAAIDHCKEIGRPLITQDYRGRQHRGGSGSEEVDSDGISLLESNAVCQTSTVTPIADKVVVGPGPGTAASGTAVTLSTANGEQVPPEKNTRKQPPLALDLDRIVPGSPNAKGGPPLRVSADGSTNVPGPSTPRERLKSRLNSVFTPKGSRKKMIVSGATSIDDLSPVAACEADAVVWESRAAIRMLEDERISFQRPSSPRKAALTSSLEDTAFRRISKLGNRSLISHAVLIEVCHFKWTKFGHRALVQSVVVHSLCCLFFGLGTMAWGGGAVEGDHDAVFSFHSHDGAQGAWVQHGGIIQAILLWLVILRFLWGTATMISGLLADIKEQKRSGMDWRNALQRDFWFYFDIGQMLCNIVFLVLHVYNWNLDVTASQWEGGRIVSSVYAILLWGKYLEFLSAHRRTGPFVKIITVMFKKDLRDFMSVYFVFLLAFAHAFYLLLTRAGNDADHEFEQPGVVTLAVFRLMVGDYEDMFSKYNEMKSAAVIVIVTFLYVMYMIMATVLMLNLLIAMLDDTWGLHKRDMEREWRLELASRIVAIEARAKSQNPKQGKELTMPLTITVPERTKGHTLEFNLQERVHSLEENLETLQKTLNKTSASLTDKLETLIENQKKEERRRLRESKFGRSSKKLVGVVGGPGGALPVLSRQNSGLSTFSDEPSEEPSSQYPARNAGSGMRSRTDSLDTGPLGLPRRKDAHGREVSPVASLPGHEKANWSMRSTSPGSNDVRNIVASVRDRQRKARPNATPDVSPSISPLRVPIECPSVLLSERRRGPGSIASGTRRSSGTQGITDADINSLDEMLNDAFKDAPQLLIPSELAMPPRDTSTVRSRSSSHASSISIVTSRVGAGSNASGAGGEGTPTTLGSNSLVTPANVNANATTAPTLIVASGPNLTTTDTTPSAILTSQVPEGTDTADGLVEHNGDSPPSQSLDAGVGETT